MKMTLFVIWLYVIYYFGCDIYNISGKGFKKDFVTRLKLAESVVVG
jgi:hypothetical protein